MENKKNILNILFIITLIILCITMFYFINKKEGFHEDEIFSYGSSNYKYDNVFQAAAHMDSRNRAIEKYIIEDNIIDTIKNIIYYSKNSKEYGELIYEIMSEDKPIWKTPEDAKSYLTVSSNEILSFGSIYYNQARDVHPPLFYFLVHIVSTLFLNNFSKYIIFTINLIFFIGTCFLLKKILKLYDKEKLCIPTIILYGMSIGAISTVIFQRMYAMLAFFCVYYLYINLKILKNNFEMDKKLNRQLIIITILGFLTQYYFCIYAVTIFVCMMIKMIKEKKKESYTKYLLNHIIAAFIGIILFPPAIYHIFFSYRGVGNGNKVNIIEKTVYYLKEILNAFSLDNYIGYILVIGFFILATILLIIKRKEIKGLFTAILFISQIIVFVVIVSKISPNVNEKYTIRYITAILPIIALGIILLIDKLISNEKINIITTSSIVITISIFGLIYNEPKYLYKGYKQYIDIANKYKNLNFVYMCDNGFTHINSLPEFMIYNKSMIINTNHDDLNFLTDETELKQQEKFILSIKKWMNVDEVLRTVLEKTGYTKYEILLDDEGDFNSKIFLIKKAPNQ